MNRKGKERVDIDEKLERCVIKGYGKKSIVLMRKNVNRREK